MKKVATVIFSLFAILLLSLNPSWSLFNVKSAEALHVGVQWGYLSPLNTTERSSEEYICDAVYDMFAGASWGCSNAYWVYTNLNSFNQVLQWENWPGNYVDFGTNWWVGDYHADPPPPTPLPFGHLWFFGNGGDIQDRYVYGFSNHYWDPWYGWVYLPSKQYLTSYGLA